MSRTREQHFKRMVFEHETTYQTDYRRYYFEYVEPPVYKFKSDTKKKRPHHIPKDIQTLTPLKCKKMQFDVLWKPKEIVRRSPYAVQERYEKPIDDGREEAQNTRPRLVMTPAVSMDDIEDPRMREIICKDTYTTEWTKASKEAVSSMKPVKVHAPLGSHPTSSNPVFIPQCKPPVVPMEWRRETIEWDNKQLRSYVNPYKEFWKKRDVYKFCTACKQTAQMTNMRKMKEPTP